VIVNEIKVAKKEGQTLFYLYNSHLYSLGGSKLISPLHFVPQCREMNLKLFI